VTQKKMTPVQWALAAREFDIKAQKERERQAAEAVRLRTSLQRASNPQANSSRPAHRPQQPSLPARRPGFQLGAKETAIATSRGVSNLPSSAPSSPSSEAASVSAPSREAVSRGAAGGLEPRSLPIRQVSLPALPRGNPLPAMKRRASDMFDEDEERKRQQLMPIRMSGQG
jgi:hypothetical protein